MGKTLECHEDNRWAEGGKSGSLARLWTYGQCYKSTLPVLPWKQVGKFTTGPILWVVSRLEAKEPPCIFSYNSHLWQDTTISVFVFSVSVFLCGRISWHILIHSSTSVAWYSQDHKWLCITTIRNLASTTYGNKRAFSFNKIVKYISCDCIGKNIGATLTFYSFIK